tara:strand:+ start:21379 stop:22323 length:945 start_codon:yes stop_codon:yes gene_type:complete
MNIVVTGGSGMVGRCIQDIIHQYPQHKFTFLSSKDCNLIQRNDVLNFFSKHSFNYIIHLAANVGGLFKNLNSNISMFSDNIKINENVLEACHKNNIRRGVFCLSSCIFPQKPSSFPMVEHMVHESPPHPSNEGYAYAKRMLELQCRQYNKTYNTEYICVVPVNLYGPYDNFNLKDSHMLPGIMHRWHLTHLNKESAYTVYGTGNPLRQFVYAPDFANFICRLLLTGQYRGKTEPIIFCDLEYSIKDIVNELALVMDIPVEKIQYDTTKSDGCMRKTVSKARLREYFYDFQFTPLKKGLCETYKWFLENYDQCRK